MSPHFNDFLGPNPLTYVRSLMRHFDFRAPPVPIEEISTYLKLVIEEVDPPPDMADEALSKVLMTTPSWLEREEKRIRVYKRAPKKRKRLSIGHENTHFIIPYHQSINPFCPNSGDPACHKNTEREAFIGAAAQIFYPKLFIPDMLSLNGIHLSGIEQLAERYVGSLEATANWYVRTNPGRCAVVIAGIPEPAQPANNNGQENEGLIHLNGASRRPGPIWASPRGPYLMDGTPRTLQVNYCISSQRFPDWIATGRMIPDTSLIFQCYSNGASKSGEIHASELGSSSQIRYHAETTLINANGNTAVLALLSLPDKQLELPISSPYTGW